MYIDKDSWGRFSINDLSEKDLRLFYEALKVYARCNFGHIHQSDNIRMFCFDSEFNNIMKDEKQNQSVDEAGGKLRSSEPWPALD